MNNTIDINNLNINQKINYVKNILLKEELTNALNILLKEEQKNLEITNIILGILKEEIFIQHIKKHNNKKTDYDAKFYVYSRIISVLSFYNKTDVLNAFFKSLSKDELKKVADYEYENKTDSSVSNKVFNKYCAKYKKEALEVKKPNDEEVLMLTMEIDKLNANKKKKLNRALVVLIILIFIMVISFGYKYYKDSKLLSKYNGVIYPGIYLNDVDLSNTKINDLENIIKEEEKRILLGTLIITNDNADYKFSYEELGIKLNDDGLYDKIINYNKNIPRYKKVSLIKNKKRYKTFNIEGYFDTSSVDDFIEKIEKTINTEPRSDGLVIDDNYNVTYDKGAKGFTLDAIKTKENILSELSVIKEETVIKAEGTVIENEVKNNHLSNINKKVSSHTTYFANAGNRGHNITLAASKLNGKVLMPNDVFSYLETVGPYGASNGYLPAPIYLNSAISTANGGGVCQLASTLYNAQLKAGLQTVYRTNHTFAPNYVAKGLDATVYSTTTDYKFKNGYEYPMYIVSYVKGNYLTVDIWSNENALGGKTYEPYSVYSNGGYLAYLKTIENGKVIETKYLDKSYYKAH